MTSRPRFFHGTRRHFTQGGYLFPRGDHGAEGTGAPVNPGMESPEDAAQWVFVTEDIDVAWAYAWVAPGRGKPKVLEVEPIGAIEPDPEHSPAMRAWRCEWAKVTRVHKESTITEAEAREGWETSPR